MDINGPYAKLIAEKTPKGRIEQFIADASWNEENFMDKWVRSIESVSDVQVISPTRLKATISFKVDPFYCNRSGNLHGGCHATIYDILTSIVLAAIDKNDVWINAGVTRNLLVNFLRPAPLGEVIECECEVVHAAKRLALLHGTMRRRSDGEIVSTCVHDKASVPFKAGWPKPKL